ncbi:MAG TPA: methyltransferase domain-containing protein [Stellaceae bacterium]|nr:methyltransferase domain-containing protein [Stellaceae bacterium]
MSRLGLCRSEPSQPPLIETNSTLELPEYIEVLATHRSSRWAWGHYKDVLADLLRIREARRVMEIGAGRFPLFDRDEIARFDVEYIANDVDPAELARAPDEVGKACFDISTTNSDEVARLSNTIDLTFSKMVFEHLSDSKQAYRNIYEILSPNGICMNFHPVLFSPPFVINYLTPTVPSEKILKKLSPKRNHEEHPKFPAKYDCCWVSESLRDTLRSIGYRRVWQLPFWFHEYFVKFPGIQQCDWALNKIAERANWTSLASYCYTIVVK